MIYLLAKDGKVFKKTLIKILFLGYCNLKISRGPNKSPTHSRRGKKYLWNILNMIYLPPNVGKYKMSKTHCFFIKIGTFWKWKFHTHWVLVFTESKVTLPTWTMGSNRNPLNKLLQMVWKTRTLDIWTKPTGSTLPSKWFAGTLTVEEGEKCVVIWL